jgi:hypothetical protein
MEVDAASSVPEKKRKKDKSGGEGAMDVDVPPSIPVDEPVEKKRKKDKKGKDNVAPPVDAPQPSDDAPTEKKRKEKKDKKSKSTTEVAT